MVNFGTAVIMKRCNPYGAESGGAKNLGGLGSEAVTTQWYCKNVATHRFRMECPHGHRGQIMDLCETHIREFGSKQMTFCPTCNSTDDHKCTLSLKEVS